MVRQREGEVTDLLDILYCAFVVVVMAVAIAGYMG